MFYLSLIALVGLFYLLDKFAELMVVNVKAISTKLGIKFFLLGIVLGLLTSLPELAIGINAVANNLEGVSVGNLLGGVVVVFCLVLGISLILNRKIETDGRMFKMLPFFIYFNLPLLIAIVNNGIGFYGGGLLVLAYLALLVYVYRIQVRSHSVERSVTRDAKISKEVIYIIFGAVVVLSASNLIVKLTVNILTQLNISQFLIGLLVFSLGTNLPEISVIFHSWKKKFNELSISHLIGSAMANVLILGLISLVNPAQVPVNLSFYVLVITFMIISALFLFFYKTDKLLTRKEVLVLVGLYAVFIFGQIVLNFV